VNEYQHRKPQGTIIKALFAVAIFIIGCILLLWSWNILAVDLFQLPEARFKHALAFGLLISGAIVFRVFISRITAAGSRHSGHHRTTEP